MGDPSAHTSSSEIIVHHTEIKIDDENKSRSKKSASGTTNGLFTQPRKHYFYF